MGFVSWSDKSGSLWLFAGGGLDSSGTQGLGTTPQVYGPTGVANQRESPWPYAMPRAYAKDTYLKKR